MLKKRKVVKLENGGIRMDFVESAATKPSENAAMPKAKPKHIGGGWYELADGRKVRKKDLKAGD